MHGLQCALSQSQANYWMHRLLPVLQHALRAMGQAPERDEGKISKLCKAVQEFHTFIDHNQVFISN
jgi:hypothetical protein